MQLHTTKNDCKNLYQAVLTSENSVVSMGVHRVIFGWRVVAWYPGDTTCLPVNWCCADQQAYVDTAYSALRNILEQREEGPQALAGLIPVSRVKPFPLDPEFVAWLGRQVTPDFQTTAGPDISELYKEYLSIRDREEKDAI
jgi:hypothetical protein